MVKVYFSEGYVPYQDTYNGIDASHPGGWVRIGYDDGTTVLYPQHVIHRIEIDEETRIT